MSRRLAEINTNVPIDIVFSEFEKKEPDYDKLIEIYRRLEFNSFIKKMNPKDLTGPSGSKNSYIPFEKASVTIINEVNRLSILEDIITEPMVNAVALKVFSDNNHKDIPEIYGVAVSTLKDYFYIDVHAEGMMKALKTILYKTNVKIIGHQLQSDYYALILNGFEDWNPNTYFDTAIAQYLIQPERSSYELKSLALEYLHKEIINPESYNTDSGQIGFQLNSSMKYEEYGIQWCESVFELMRLLNDKLEEEGLSDVFT